MSKQTIQHFFLGLMIAFTISVITVSAIMSIISDTGMVPVSLLAQSFVLSILCSLINLIYRAEKLKFMVQSILGYILTTSTIMFCGLVFGWFSFGGNNLNRASYIFVYFLICSLCYLITWTIIWRITEAKKKELNDKLKEYKQKR